MENHDVESVPIVRSISTNIATKATETSHTSSLLGALREGSQGRFKFPKMKKDTNQATGTNAEPLLASAINVASDPVMQQAALNTAKQVGASLLGYAEDGAELVAKYVEQGPDGIRVLAFLGGLFSFLLSALTLVNPLELLTNPIEYVVCLYQAAFACTTMLMECDPDWTKKIQALQDYQHWLDDQAKFLLRVYGRGLFYLFQGSLWLLNAGLFSPICILCGLWMVGVGVIFLCMHYGVLPDECIGIVRRKLTDGLNAAQHAIERTEAAEAKSKAKSEV